MTDYEVARYGLRTFRVMPREGYPPTLLEEWFNRNFPRKPEMVLGPVFINDGTLWLDGVCEAACVKDDEPELFHRLRLFPPHAAPADHCKCGIHALLSLDELERQYREHASKVVTVVAAEGQTIIGTKGFRTERAEVVAYWCNPNNRNILEMCQRQFREATGYVTKGEMLRDFHLPRSLRGAA